MDSLPAAGTGSFGADLTAVTMGIDRFERGRNREDGLLDTEGLVPIYLGADRIAANRYEHWWDVEDDLNGLQDRVPALACEHRRMFAGAMIRSLKIAVRLFAGASPSFEVKVRDLVGAPTGAVDPAIIEATRDRIDVLLGRQNVVRGDLAQRIAAWESQRFLEPEAIEPTAEPRHGGPPRILLF